MWRFIRIIVYWLNRVRDWLDELYEASDMGDLEGAQFPIGDKEDYLDFRL